MPTGGVTSDNLGEWLAAGAVAAGAGSELCSPAAMRDGDWAAIERNARLFSSALAATRAAA
jgi:2-dehydro-3-deoxyphosphogluconate aldolase/(4S)-4-hydroxy-2-oxoglutarate aldolase